MTPAEPIRDDTMLGRARVSDAPELEAYYAELAAREAGALWTVANKIEPWYPQPQSTPVLWRYAELRPLVRKALDLVSADDAGRRVVMLVNPGRRDVSAAVGLLYTGLQIMGPGESMTAHRHRGRRTAVRPRRHRRVDDRRRRETARRPRRLRHHPQRHVARARQRRRRRAGHLAGRPRHPPGQRARRRLLRSTPRPAPAARQGRQRVRGLVRRQPAAVRRGEVDPAVLAAARLAVGSHLRGAARPRRRGRGLPYDGVIAEYTNPVTGGSVMPTMGAHMQLLRPGQATRAHRHTGSVVYTVAKGQGVSVIAGTALPVEQGRHFRRPVLGVARARQPRRLRRRLPVLLRRLPRHALARLLAGRGVCRQRRTPAAPLSRTTKEPPCD
ncbi:hypothetical protein ACU686_45220 [Yinghuangia aomiensis]